MKKVTHNILWLCLLSVSVVFGQKQKKEVSESFKVNSDAVVQINTSHTDVTIELWNKNQVSVEGVWEIEGLTKEEAEAQFKNWDFEALGNNHKVVINSNSHDRYPYDIVFNHDFDFDFDFDFDSLSYIGNLFDSNFHFEIPPMPMEPMIPESFTKHLAKIEFDYKAYEEDKEGYMKKFEENQKKWEAEYRKNVEPKMKAFEEKMRKWEEKHADKLRAQAEKMEKWEKENASKLKAMEKRAEKMQKEVEKKYAKLLEERERNASNGKKIMKKLVIKIPRNAKVKLHTRYGKTSIPDGMKTVD